MVGPDQTTLFEEELDDSLLGQVEQADGDDPDAALDWGWTQDDEETSEEE